MTDYSNVFIEDEFKNAYKKNEEENLYKVTIRKLDNSIDAIEDAVDVVFNNSVLSVASIHIIRYYKLKHLINWSVERLN